MPTYNITFDTTQVDNNPTQEEFTHPTATEDQPQDEANNSPQDEENFTHKKINYLDIAIERIFGTCHRDIIIALDELGIQYTQDFMYLEKSDFEETSLKRVHIRKLLTMQQWYCSHQDPCVGSVYPGVISELHRHHTKHTCSYTKPTHHVTYDPSHKLCI